MGGIPEGFEPYVDEDGDELWLTGNGARQYINPNTDRVVPGSGWRRFYVGPPPPKPRSLEDKVRDLAARFDRLSLEAGRDPVRSNAWRDAADDLRGLLS